MRIVVDGLPYPIVITDAAPGEIASFSRDGTRWIIVCDRNVEARGALIVDALRAAGCEVLATEVVEAGERRKSWKAASELHAAYLRAAADRETIVVAIGGGTLTDVAGFAAATFMRGIRWLAVPTTLLGMVDASIGGKTGIDRPEGKNLIGAVWQPIGVIADVASLTTLPPAQLRGGVAEIVKAAVIGDPGLLENFGRRDQSGGQESWAQIIARAAGVKARIVAGDPDDRGARAVLNLGHTFAHAIELASRFRVPHGAAVALGLRAAGVLARDLTGWSYADHRRVLKVLRGAGLRVAITTLSIDSILEAMRVDKKRRNGVLRFVIPVRLGEVRAGVVVAEDAVREAVAALTTRPVRGAW